jgi:thiol:disulfide interchange protein DsbD
MKDRAKDHSFPVGTSDTRWVDVIVRTPSTRSFLLPAIALLLSSFLLYGQDAWGQEATAGAGPVVQLIERDGEHRVEARLVRTLGTGTRARVGVVFDLAPGWHVYWRSSGDTGLPPELSWDVEGAEIGPIQWPAPRAFEAGSAEAGAASYGYQDRVLLASDVHFTRSATSGTRLAVDGDVLVCEYECVPASFRLGRNFGDSLPEMSAEEEAALFAEFAARLPDSASQHDLELSVAWSQSAVRPGDRFEGAIAIRSCVDKLAGCEVHEPPSGDELAAIFFSDDMDSITLRVAGMRKDPSDPLLHWVELRGEAESGEEITERRVTGVLALRSEGGTLRHVEVDLPFPTAAAETEVAALGRHWLDDPGEAEAVTSSLGLLRALLLALLGGLVLNLMPCVLPVLAIKVFSISEMAEAAHTGRSEPIRHGIAYTTGILASMAALGICVVLLRAAGHSVGWGFQFQEPIYVAAISAVVLAFALNLFGVFEIRGGVGKLGDLGQQATGARRSFFEGLLAVALATPCSAPFLGTAIGFAFTSPPGVILAIFLAVGLGLAAPFALVTLIPSWARFVPRSGAWMQVVRAGLGFALLSTVVWLLWIFGGGTGMEGLLNLIAFLLGLAFVLWCFGLLQRSQRPRLVLGAGVAVLVFGAAGLNAVNAEIDRGVGEAAADRSGLADASSPWRQWSPSAVQAHLAAGAPAFVRFTADWCITCKVNERVTLKDARVIAALESGGLGLFVGDWTQRNDAIREELARHGRAGVPLYLVYHPARPNAPQILPELLTPGLVLAAVRSVAKAP